MPPREPVLLVRADASVAVGLGHAMRCLALAQGLADDRGGRAVFLLAETPPAFAARATAEGCAIEPLAAAPGTEADAEETLAAARAHGARWVVCDGYGLGDGYVAALVAGGARVLAFDDHGRPRRTSAHLLLNHGVAATPEPYAGGAPHTRLLLGPRYALLRREFRLLPGPARTVAPVARRILVTLGGSDPDDVSSRVLAGLAAVAGPLEVCVLAGGANPHGASLARAAAASPHAVQVVVDAADVPARMAWADLAVCAAGGTALELARTGTPQATIVLADNQRPAGRGLAEAGVATVLGWHAALTPEGIGAAVGELAADAVERARQAARGPALVDGQGALRVLGAMGLAASPAAAVAG